jgi:Holliday junction DNA helicase RuvB
MTELPRLMDQKIQPDDHSERALRPRSLDDFTGQSHLVPNLKVFLEAARRREQSLDHVLFYGPPGLGKTTLAQIVANELGVQFRATSGPVLAKAGDLAAILTHLQPRDVLFIDEIHRLHPSVEEILYPAMEDYKLDLVIGEGPSARSIQIDLPPFTLVAATTRTGLIGSPLRDRFGIPLRLAFYTPEELSKIILRNSQLIGLKLHDDGVEEIASRSRGTPRIAGRLLRRISDFALVGSYDYVSKALAHEALNRLGVDPRGLDQQDRAYLERMAYTYNGGPVGIDTLAAALSEQKDTLEDVIEPYLMQEGLIQRTSRGRQLTADGYRYLGLSVPKPLDGNPSLFDGENT